MPSVDTAFFILTIKYETHLDCSVFCVHNLRPWFLSLHKEEPLPGLTSQTSASAGDAGHIRLVMLSLHLTVGVSPFYSVQSCPLCHCYSPSVISESCNVSRPSMYSLLDDMDDVILHLSGVGSRYYDCGRLGTGADRCTEWPTCSLPDGSLDFCTKLAKGM